MADFVYLDALCNCIPLCQEEGEVEVLKEEISSIAYELLCDGTMDSETYDWYVKEYDLKRLG